MGTEPDPVDRILQHFVYTHLLPELQHVARPCADLADHMAKQLPIDPETVAGLRKLLEAKDCLVRATTTALNVKAPF